MINDKPLGSVIQGSLSQGLEVRLHSDVSVEEMRVGKFLVVRGIRAHFFCMLTDVSLETASQRILANPPRPDDDFMQAVLLSVVPRPQEMGRHKFFIDIRG